MKRAIPWIIAVVALIAFGVSFSELQRMRGRFTEVTRYQDTHHQYFRESMIRAELADAASPILVIGDSITEHAKLPETISGHPVINAGIGGATIEDFEKLAPSLIQDAKPWLIAVSLGANDAKSKVVQQSYAALLAKLKNLTGRVIAVAVTTLDGSDRLNAQIRSAAESEGVRFVEMSIPDEGRMPDKIHLSPSGYLTWTPMLVAAISKLSS